MHRGIHSDGFTFTNYIAFLLSSEFKIAHFLFRHLHFKIVLGSRPSGLVIKFSTFHFGGLGLVPGHGLTPLISSHAVVATHVQNRGRLAQMLAQGQSSSAKKKKTKEENWQWMLTQDKSSSATTTMTKIVWNFNSKYIKLVKKQTGLLSFNFTFPTYKLCHIGHII